MPSRVADPASIEPSCPETTRIEAICNPAAGACSRGRVKATLNVLAEVVPRRVTAIWFLPRG